MKSWPSLLRALPLVALAGAAAADEPLTIA